MVFLCETAFKCDAADYFVLGRHSNAVVIMIYLGPDNTLWMRQRDTFKYQNNHSKINRHNATKSLRIIH